MLSAILDIIWSTDIALLTVPWVHTILQTDALIARILVLLVEVCLSVLHAKLGFTFPTVLHST